MCQSLTYQDDHKSNLFLAKRSSKVKVLYPHYWLWKEIPAIPRVGLGSVSGTCSRSHSHLFWIQCTLRNLFLRSGNRGSRKTQVTQPRGKPSQISIRAWPSSKAVGSWVLIRLDLPGRGWLSSLSLQWKLLLLLVGVDHRSWGGVHDTHP